ncbi:TetR family transcriptional regulator [Stutzerimonas kirkiae]|uniref:TetR family transcriptional regulator n=1 Tax=Stutzerimonas kirkiae TaxID=2211392 RepID=A0A4Q9REB9_9GAMM|nr:TetR family transcriptional regulator [Stutzerimonas kirkiae]TBU98403.1 TetR family transcriptional regulator [Stutzerimonas kirkiae]TBV02024.1 TetR family transcriptional regulator [Stutzerimonas kirkiae]TBV06982.1 TetR family transcriptional regulator [Stutzerimonas kirkiae]TBV16297.1 TetR family transcriptional regulator [Stutzerimonas kirkiae]
MRRTKEDAEKTRLKVIEAALEQFSKTGYSRTTLAMIADAAGFSRGPIYWHFKNKDELYEAVLHYSQEPLEQLVARSLELTDAPLEAIRYLIVHWFRLLIENRWHRQSFEILLNKTELTSQVAGTMRRERKLTRLIVQCLASLVEAARQRGQLAEGQPAEDIAVLLYSALMGITQTWLADPKLFSLKKQADFFSASLLRLLPHTG